MSNVRVLRSRLNPLRRRIRGSRLTFSTGERVFRRIGFAQAEKNPSQQIFPANDLARLSPPTDQSPVTESRYARITREKRDEQMYLSRINSRHNEIHSIRFMFNRRRRRQQKIRRRRKKEKIKSRREGIYDEFVIEVEKI